MQRRNFVIATGGLLVSTATTATAATAAPQAAALSPPPVTQIPAGLRMLDSALFEGLLNQQFTVYASARGMSMQLTDVRKEKSAPGSEQFTLIFAAPGVTLPNGTYEVEQNAIGKTHLYLQQGEPGKDLYQAHFNLLV